MAGDNDFLLAENFAQAIDTDGDTILDARASRGHLRHRGGRTGILPHRAAGWCEVSSGLPACELARINREKPS